MFDGIPLSEYLRTSGERFIRPCITYHNQLKMISKTSFTTQNDMGTTRCISYIIFTFESIQWIFYGFNEKQINEREKTQLKCDSCDIIKCGWWCAIWLWINETIKATSTFNKIKLKPISYPIRWMRTFWISNCPQKMSPPPTYKGTILQWEIKNIFNKIKCDKSYTYEL